MPRGRRSGYFYVEVRSCHHCHTKGHLLAKCPMLTHESMKLAEMTEHQEKEDRLLHDSAEPLPILDHRGDVRWQNERAEVPREIATTS